MRNIILSIRKLEEYGFGGVPALRGTEHKSLLRESIVLIKTIRMLKSSQIYDVEFSDVLTSKARRWAHDRLNSNASPNRT